MEARFFITQFIFCFAVGGLIVSLFAALGDVLNSYLRVFARIPSLIRRRASPGPFTAMIEYVLPSILW